MKRTQPLAVWAESLEQAPALSAQGGRGAWERRWVREWLTRNDTFSLAGFSTACPPGA